MITIAKALEDIIVKSPQLEEFISKGLINTSALARELRPQLQKRLYKKNISTAALIMAIKRLQPKVKKKSLGPAISLKVDNITVRSNLVEITLVNSQEVEKTRKELSKVSFSDREAFFTMIQGVKESTFVISKNLVPIVGINYSGKIMSKIENLSSISIALPPVTKDTPGVHYMLIKSLAWNNINLVETISNYNDLSFIFKDKDIEKAFSVIKSLAS